MLFKKTKQNTEHRSEATGRQINFHQYRNRRKTGVGGMVRMLVYGAMALAFALMLLELVTMVGK